MITKLVFDIERALLRLCTRRSLSKEMGDAVNTTFPTELKMITPTGRQLIKESADIESAMGFVTEKILRPGHPQSLFVPPTRKKKVDENGNILKPLIAIKTEASSFTSLTASSWGAMWMMRQELCIVTF